MKKLFNLFLFYLLLLLPIVSFAASVGGGGDNTIQLGDPSGANVDVKVGAGQLKWDDTASKLQFSNNQVDFKDIGSGSGGGQGQNFLENGDAESGTTNWVAVGTATLTASQTTPINGAQDFDCDLAAQNDACRTVNISVPRKFAGKECQLTFTYEGGTDSLIEPVVTDSSDVVITSFKYKDPIDESAFLKQISTDPVTRSIFGFCPSSGDIRVSFLQTAVGDPAAIQFDDVHIGENFGLVESRAPGHYSARGDNAGVISSEGGGDWINGNCTESPAGQFSCPFNPGFFTVTPSCGASDQNQGGTTRLCDATANGTTAVIVKCLNTTLASETLEGDTDWNVWCDAQSPDDNAVKTYFKSTPTRAEFQNEFTAHIDAAATIQSGGNWISSVTDTGTGQYDVNFIGSIFSAAPECTVTGYSGTRNCYFQGATATDDVQVDCRSTDGAGTQLTSGFYLRCSRTEANKVAAQANLQLVKQVISDKTDPIRIGACRVDNSGSATINSASTLCAGFISSVNRTGAGRITHTFATAFAAVPECTCSSFAPNEAVCNVEGVTTSTVQTITATSGPTAVDRDVIIECKGAK